MKIFNVDKNQFKEIVDVAKKCQDKVILSDNNNDFDLVKDSDKLISVFSLFTNGTAPELSISTNNTADAGRFLNYILSMSA